MTVGPAAGDGPATPQSPPHETNDLTVLKHRGSASAHPILVLALYPFSVILLTFWRFKLCLHIHIPKVGLHKEERKVGGTELVIPLVVFTSTRYMAAFSFSPCRLNAVLQIHGIISLST